MGHSPGGTLPHTPNSTNPGQFLLQDHKLYFSFMQLDYLITVTLPLFIMYLVVNKEQQFPYPKVWDSFVGEHRNQNSASACLWPSCLPLHHLSESWEEWTGHHCCCWLHHSPFGCHQSPLMNCRRNGNTILQ